MRKAEGPLDSDLPLEALDRALAPVRRSVAFSLRSRTVPRHLPAAILPHLAKAARLELVPSIADAVGELVATGEALAAAPEEAWQEHLERLFADLTRLDAWLGLPVPRALRAPNKRRYQPQVEPPPKKEPKPKGSAESARQRPRVDEGGEEPDRLPWSGRTDELVDDVLPGAKLPGLTIEGLLALRPVDHAQVDGVHGAGRPLPTEGLVAAGGRVQARITVCHGDGRQTARALLAGAGPLWCRWEEEEPPSAASMAAGERVVLVGHVVGDELVDAEVAPDEVTHLAKYDGVPERRVREALVRFAALAERMRDPVGVEARRAASLPGRAEAHLALHGASEGPREAGRRRLAFDEALLAALGAAGRAVRGDRGLPHTLLFGGVSTLQRHGVVLSDEQQLAFEEIKRDLRRGTPMRRVLTGEVGAGKGTVALAAMATVAEGKSQVLVLAPDASESEHRFLHTEPLLRQLGLVARRVADPSSTSVQDAIRRGEIHVVFGTHALLEANLPFRRLGLVVSVERFPFGGSGTADLPTPRPDLLVVTQVPVGARIACSAYADFELSVVDHAGRRPARIEVLRGSERERAYAQLREAVASGQQGTVLFPRVGGADVLALNDARALVAAMKESELTGCRVGLLHGQQSFDEQRRVYDDFAHRRVDVLVTTLALEDGPSVPGLVVTVVEQADHVEQWRLHRVIGFLSTSSLPSVAVLVVGEHASPDAEARVQRVLDAPDGYSLTEARVDVRGLEECVAPGVPPLPVFDALRSDDLDLVLAARSEAHRMLKADPHLRRGSHQDLAREVRESWDRRWPDAPEGWDCPFRADGGGGDRKRRRRRRRRK